MKGGGVYVGRSSPFPTELKGRLSELCNQERVVTQPNCITICECKLHTNETTKSIFWRATCLYYGEMDWASHLCGVKNVNCAEGSAARSVQASVKPLIANRTYSCDGQMTPLNNLGCYHAMSSEHPYPEIQPRCWYPPRTHGTAWVPTLKRRTSRIPTRAGLMPRRIFVLSSSTARAVGFLFPSKRSETRCHYIRM